MRCPPADCRYTQNGNTLYLHIFAWPFRFLYLEGLVDKVAYVQLLHDGSVVNFKRIAHFESLDVPENAIVLDLPVKKPDVVVPVVEIILK